MMYLVFLIVSDFPFPVFKVFVCLLITKINKKICSLNYLIWLNIVGITINIGFLVVGVYYFHEFLYFINMDNINVTQLTSNDGITDCEYTINYIVDSDKTINKGGLFNTTIQKDVLNSRYNYKTNNGVNNDGLTIVKHLEIYRSAREQSALLEKSLTNHNLYLVSRINRLEKEIDHSTDLITEIIDSYLNDFGL